MPVQAVKPALLVSVLVIQIAAAQETSQVPHTSGNANVTELAFEVASIKPNTLGQESFLWSFRNGRFIARYATLKALIRSAYGKPELVLTERQVIGGPRWLDADRFDIEATAPNVPNSPRALSALRC